METRANYVLIGFFTLLISVGLLAFGLWAAKYSSDRTWQNFEVVFDEAVTGLGVGSPVQFNGISVGSITSLAISPDDPRLAVVQLRVESTTPIKTDTRAKMAITSVTGPSIIQLIGGKPESKRLVDVDKRDVPVILTEPSALQNISDTAGQIAARLDVLLSNENINELSTTIKNLEAISSALADKDKGVQALLANANSTVRSLDGTLKTAQGTLQSVDQNLVKQLPSLINKLEGTLNKLDATAGNANGLLEDNRAAISNFTHDGLGQIGPTMVELRTLVRDLRQVSNRLEESPARFILGRDGVKEFQPQ